MRQPNIESLSIYCDNCILHLMFYAGRRQFSNSQIVYRCSRCGQEKYYDLSHNTVEEVSGNAGVYLPVGSRQPVVKETSSNVGLFIISALIGSAIILYFFWAQSDKHCAIVYSLSTGQTGKAWGYRSNNDAVEAAKKDCGRADCAYGGSTVNNCLALANSQNGTLSAQAKSKKDAENQALGTCRSRQWKKCQLIASVCSNSD